MPDREGHGHKAVLYKSHFPTTKAFLLERHHCIHRLINHVYTKDQTLSYSLPHDNKFAATKEIEIIIMREETPDVDVFMYLIW